MKSIKRRIERVERKRGDGRVVFHVTVEDTTDLPDPKPGEPVIIIRGTDDEKR